jgi:hypothetical protein
MEFFELGVTPAGEALWPEAERLFHGEYKRVQRLHAEEFEAFLRRHPDFEEKRQAYFDALNRWVRDLDEPRPKWRWTYPDWPYPPR